MRPKDFDWTLVDGFTIAQAAALLAGFNPNGLQNWLIIAPIHQMLCNAVALGTLSAEPPPNRSRVRDYSDYVVSRKALREFAKLKGLEPAFLVGHDGLVRRNVGQGARREHSQDTDQAGN